ncbi:MAG: hypothetical protein N4A54_03995 [Peptostreptococcaceae bacterium]|jgi:hypothetical protein|nr:hypothetical protein [Peptostreptococcaceae bacterium]
MLSIKTIFIILGVIDLIIGFIYFKCENYVLAVSTIFGIPVLCVIYILLQTFMGYAHDLCKNCNRE